MEQLAVITIYGWGNLERGGCGLRYCGITIYGWGNLKEGAVAIVEWSRVLLEQLAVITIYGWGNLERGGCGNGLVVYCIVGTACCYHYLWLGET